MFTSTGIIQYDPGLNTKQFEYNWALLLCDDDIARHYAWHLKKFGIETYSNDKGLWKTHISFLKGDEVINSDIWKKYNGYEVEFNYNHWIRYDNGKHAWLDVYSEDLSAIREELGFEFKPWYHLTIGKLMRPYL